MRTPEELLAAFDAATAENPLLLQGSEVDTLTRALKQRGSNRFGSGPRINPDIGGYRCPITGGWVDGKSAHRENLKRHGCRNMEPGETREYRKSMERERNQDCAKLAHEMVKSIAHQVEV